MRHQAFSISFLVLLVFRVEPAFACPDENSAKVVSLKGSALVESGAKQERQNAQLNQKICEDSKVTVMPNSLITLALPGDLYIDLSEKTSILLKKLNLDVATIIKVYNGFLNFISRKPKEVQIENGITNAMPVGTEFAFNADEANASVWVYEGKVKVFNPFGSLILKPGTAYAHVQKGHAPTLQIDIKPEDAVNWALYYPPLMPYPAKTDNIDSDLKAAIEDYRHGRVDVALNKLDSLSLEKQTSYFHKIRGAMRLTVGQDKLAQDDIQWLLKQNPKDAEALALKSVIALTQNRKDEALQLAQQAVSANPQSMTAFTALSYAEQGRFDLDKAYKAALQASKLAPQDALVWARQAELELSMGLTDDSEDSANRAYQLDPMLERTQTIRGFSYLQQMEAEDAEKAFAHALELDSTSPLARLGLGLAKIRKGDLELGRKDIEIAAILDPNNSLIRSYLGKAYYEEKRNPLAEEQFNLAKARDPKDPTPYFYDALKKQTENRPVEALKDLQKAMDLNDNRAVYRSKQLLDADRAARGATLARIYDNLGFQQRGIVEAISSLQTDSTNYSAHRFLSDSYVNQPGRETAQLSELLQAKLLQPININPVQPHLSVSQRGLLTASGIANSSFQDFTRVFEGNRPQLLVSGIAGNQGILGDEVVLSGIYNKFSYSLGQFHYETDGFNRFYGPIEDRKNSLERDNIYDIFLQSAINEYINLQFEYINRETKIGDFSQNIIPGESYKEQNFLRQNIYRLGENIKFNENNSLLLSFIHNNNNTHADFDATTNPNKDIRNTNFELNLFESQYLTKNKNYDLKIGYAFYHTNRFLKTPFLTSYVPFLDDGSNGHRPYLYLNLRPFGYLSALIGLAYNINDNNVIQEKNSYPKQGLYPKLGLLWDINKSLKLRFAYFRDIKRPIADLQTLEPTNIVGFNQFYDDIADRYYAFYGGAIDFKYNTDSYLGLEISRRDVKSIKEGESLFNSDNAKFYINWLYNDNYSFSFNYNYNQKDRKNAELLTSHIIPFEARYFKSNGLFGSFGAIYVNQEMQNPNKNTDFFLLNVSIGYRIPKRLGIISFEIKNLLNERFRFESLQQDEANVFFNSNTFIPQRSFFGKITFNF